MSQRVFKYPISIFDETTIRLPRGAGILHVGQQNDQMFLWAMVDPGQKQTERRTFRIAGTGHELTDVETLTYIGSVQTHGGTLIWHVFEREDAWDVASKTQDGQVVA